MGESQKKLNVVKGILDNKFSFASKIHRIYAMAKPSNFKVSYSFRERDWEVVRKTVMDARRAQRIKAMQAAKKAPKLGDFIVKIQVPQKKTVTFTGIIKQSC